LSYLKLSWKADNFKFTGKESLQGTGYIDFGARWYDNIVPRFTTIDPLAEISRRFSPFVYGNNNPLRFIDPDGMASVGADGLTNDQWLAARGNSNAEQESRDENKDKDKKKKKEETKESLPTLAQATSNGLNPNGDGIQADHTIESIIIPIFRPFGWAYNAIKFRFFVNVASQDAGVGLYAGVKAASKYLQTQGVPRVYRKQILQSFEIETVSLKIADNATYGLRFNAFVGVTSFVPPLLRVFHQQLCDSHRTNI
jgi:RHS repeat-associated protein